MRPEDYPAQEPFSPPARLYHDMVMGRADLSAAEEIPYGPDPYQRVLIWRAAKPTGILLAFLHGGGWTNGYKEWMAFMAPAFADAGIGFASVGYRLAPQHLFPIGFDDTCRGLALLIERARSYGAEPDRVFVGGHSAGGHYAALMALTRPDLRLRGCLPISGVYDFGPASGLSARPRFLGSADSGNEQPASPIANIPSAPPPFLIAHGSEDFPHLIVQAQRMENALKAAGGNVELLALPGRTHFTASYAGGEPDGPWVARAVDWMLRI
ncbi:MAG: alpha/beta hydrolase [Xanthobacteraceae bacterium]